MRIADGCRPGRSLSCCGVYVDLWEADEGFLHSGEFLVASVQQVLDWSYSVAQGWQVRASNRKFFGDSISALFCKALHLTWLWGSAETLLVEKEIA